MASELLVEPLLGLGARGVQEVEGRLITYLPPPADPEAFVRRAQAALREATGLDQLALTWYWQDHREWALLWRQGLGPRRITDRLVVTPSWCGADTPDGAVVVTIDPGMAFGTAEHETTRGALRLMDRALSPARGFSTQDAVRPFSRFPSPAWVRIMSWRSISIRTRVRPPGRMRP